MQVFHKKKTDHNQSQNERQPKQSAGLAVGIVAFGVGSAKGETIHAGHWKAPYYTQTLHSLNL